MAPLPVESGQLNLRMLLDVSSVEVFANGGEVVMTDLFFPNGDFTKIEISSEGPVTLKESHIYPLESIWIGSAKGALPDVKSTGSAPGL